MWRPSFRQLHLEEHAVVVMQTGWRRSVVPFSMCSHFACVIMDWTSWSLRYVSLYIH